MTPNVFVTTRERGKLKQRWVGHNVWLDPGRDYLRRMMTLQSMGPDVPEIDIRPKYLQFGIGGDRQSPSLDAGLVAAYPAGEDPNATNGRQYNHHFPYDPLVSTLERPIRRSGGSTPYPGAPGDNWYTTAVLPRLRVTNPTPPQCALNYRVNLSGGEFTYGSFTAIPLSEMGIVNTAEAVANTPFTALWAYVNFDPVFLTSSLELEVIWIISF
jgi:hypothetical protein